MRETKKNEKKKQKMYEKSHENVISSCMTKSSFL